MGTLEPYEVNSNRKRVVGEERLLAFSANHGNGVGAAQALNKQRQIFTHVRYKGKLILRFRAVAI